MSYTCPAKYFKCPGYYCVPYRNVCDKKWDCPWGTDEIKNTCTQRDRCTGLYKCHKSAICVTALSMCDAIQDCPYADDELFCHPFIPKCATNCSCVFTVFKVMAVCLSRVKLSSKCRMRNTSTEPFLKEEMHNSSMPRGQIKFPSQIFQLFSMHFVHDEIWLRCTRYKINST